MSSQLEVGDRVKVLDGHGIFQAEATVFAVCTEKAIVFVSEELPLSGEVVYGVPLGALEKIEYRPSLSEVIEALRECFVDEEGTKS